MTCLVLLLGPPCVGDEDGEGCAVAFHDGVLAEIGGGVDAACELLACFSYARANIRGNC